MDIDGTKNFPDLRSGTGLNGGKYIIEKKIGEGGFGIAYRAMQTGLNRVVCIKEYFPAGSCVRDTYAKTIHLQGMDEEKFERYRKAFVKEAQTLAALHHPGIVEVIDIFDENNTSYMVMPFVEGRSLQSIVETNGPLTYPEAVNYIGQVANAVGYIHDRHILHRDIKPDNIMITADYKAVLIDFGSAREFEEDKTQAHTSMLTHGYAPTEQYTRNSRKGAYTDIYAIGATLYFILTGKVPMEAAARITETMPEPKELNPDLPDEANRTIMKAMQLKSQNRHQSIGEFMDDLRNVKPSAVVPETVTPAPSSSDSHEKNEARSMVDASVKAIPQAESTPREKSNKMLIITLAAVTVVVLCVVLFFVIGGESQKHKEAAIHVDEYNQAVKCCKRVVEVWGENTDSLIMARDVMENTVRRLETEYAQEMPEVYNKLQGLADALFPKLKAVAKEYADDARGRIIAGDDPGTIMQELELSLRIFDDPSVRRELDDYKEMYSLSSSL